MKTLRFRLSAVVLLLCARSALFSEESILELFSPAFLAGGARVTTLESPQGMSLNPAVGAGKQRLTLDLNAVLLPGLGSALGLGGDAGLGYAVNAGVTVPTRVGVVSAALRLAGADFASLQWGTFGSVNLAFSKDIFPDVYVGAGLSGQFGVQTGSLFAWGLGLDLGALFLPGDLGALKDFRWGFALRNLGKGYPAARASDPFSTPPAFTPALGVSFSLLPADSVVWTIASDLSIPWSLAADLSPVVDARLSLGTELAISDTVFLQLSVPLDLRQLMGVEPFRIPVSGGLTLKIRTGVQENSGSSDFTEAGANRGEIRPEFALAPLPAGIWAFAAGMNVPLGVIDTVPPRITLDTEGVKYLSPNYDGIKDDIVLPFSIEEERYIKGYQLMVKDAQGNAVRAIVNKEEQPKERNLAAVIAGLLAVKSGIQVPETLRWDGKSDLGAVVPDGTYTYMVEAWDDNGNRGRSASGTAVVDTAPPAVTVTAPYLVFSPNGDGNKDVLAVEQAGSEEDLWQGTIRTAAGQDVARLSWANSAPKPFSWDAKDASGARVPDGVYAYRVTATDRAGNAGSAALSNILVDTRETPMRLEIDLSFFSPNGDGVKDAVRFTFHVPNTNGIERWTLAVRDRDGKAGRIYAGGAEIPASVEWDGRGDAGAVLPEGEYTAALDILYVNGNHPKDVSPAIVVDVTPPAASVRADEGIFSPDGDGRKDTVTLQLETSEEPAWAGSIFDAAGNRVRTAEWRGKADSTIVWNGRDDNGMPLPDGVYAYTLEATDRAGNKGGAAPVKLVLDTRPTPLQLVADPPDFSPNGDGAKDGVRLIPSLGLREGVEGWIGSVRDAEGRVVRSFQGKGEAPAETVWDGKDDAGRPAPDGRYEAELEVTYAKGNRPSARSNPFFLDTVPPRAEAGAAVTLFSPNGDGNLDTAGIRQTSSEEDLWEGEMRNAGGEKVRGWSWKGTLEDFLWDGRADGGGPVPDGTYVYAAKSTDRAGNAGVSAALKLTVDTRPTTVRIAADPAYFSPNGDGVKDSARLIPVLGLGEGIESWNWRIRDARGGVVRTFRGAKTVPGETVWDGRDDAGRAAADGQYDAELEVVYAKGNHPMAHADPFFLDTAPPTVDVGADVALFSPDGDGSVDTVSFRQSSSEEDLWEGEIRDAKAEKVRSLSWKGKTAEFSWDGRGDSGALVPDGSYTYMVRSTDRAGNMGKSAPITVRSDTRATPVRFSTNITWFSPDGNGVKDSITLIPSLTETAGVDAWTIRIRNAKAGAVRTFTGTGGAPRETVWDGRDEAGRAVPDGQYGAELEVLYAKGNRPTAQSNPFYIDTVAPKVEAGAAATLFSPDGDGNLDTVGIRQTSSEEDLWEGEIRDAKGQKVRSLSWKGTVAEFSWDGRGDAGALVPDGAYTYAVKATDRAGNAGSSVSVRLTVDTRPTPLRLAVDPAQFSPNGDGVKDALRLVPAVELADGVDAWTYRIRDAGGTTVRSIAGRQAVPPETVWDGKDDSGRAAADGRYTAELEAVYAKGNRPKTQSEPFLIDTVPPTAVASAAVTLFSPDGDGNLDVVSVRQASSEEDLWEGEMRSGTGEKVRSLSWRGKAPDFLWDGRGDAGAPVADGTYAYVVKATDRAGNTGSSAPLRLSVDTRSTPLRLSVDPAYFSPNGDGVKDAARLVPDVGLDEGIDVWTLRIRNADGILVRIFAGRQSVPRETVWDGRDEAGRAVPDGQYGADLEAVYAKGNRPRALSGPFFVDTTAPRADVGAAVTLFSPDGDGNLDTATIRQSSSGEDLWEGEIRSAGGAKIRSLFWRGTLSNYSWNGTDENGNRVPDGFYSYEVRATDKAGNRTVQRLERIEVDTRPTPVYITVSSQGLSPNGDGFMDAVELTTFLGLQEGIDSWSVSMAHGTAGVQKVLTGKGAPPERLSWDGMADGRRAEEGTYAAVLRLAYAKGNAPLASTAPFLLDATPPRAEIDLSPVPFSPDNDGVDDELAIGLRVTDRSAVESWDAAILDPMGHVFYRFAGKGMPATRVLWNGLSEQGELVQAAEDYPFVLTLRDELGNTGASRALIQVDVLVLREGDKLKVRISSINFAAYTADYMNVPADMAERNMRTIRRLAEIFRKYPRHQIRIEGHAVMEYWDDPKRGEEEQKKELVPLSKARADSIRDALIKAGLNGARISTEGLGGSQPIVPFGDLDNRWKDRRVEFILVRE